mgnify:CR=1 FL=1
MPDTGSNIIIDISGNTANMATDFAAAGVGITNAHVPIQKLAFGDDTVTKRVSSSEPLPITIQSNQERVGVSGDVGITGFVQVGNYGEIPVQGSTFALIRNFVKVAGSTSGDPVGVTGHIQGVAGGFPVGISGNVAINETSGMPVKGISGTDGLTGDMAPVRVTGGRRLHYTTDSIRIDNTTIGISGGRTILAATDSIKTFGSDGGNKVKTVLFASEDGASAGFSGDALKVAVTNTAFSATVNVSSTHGVTNAAEPPLRIQGFTAGSQHDPVIIRGENDGSVPVVASTSIPVTFNETITIDDANIVNALEGKDKPLITNLNGIKLNSDQIPLIRNDLSAGNFKVTVVQTEQPEVITSGTKTISTVAAQLLTTAALSEGVRVKASIDNTDTILIGGFKLVNDSAAGFPLEPGESCYLNIDNIGKIYCRSNTGRQQVSYLGS